MAQEGDPPNVGRWTTLFATLGALVAAGVHGVIAYYAVTGYTFDWLEWERQAMVQAMDGAVILGLAVFLVTFVVTGIFGAIAYALVRRDKLRGVAAKGKRREDAAWTEFTFGRAAGFAVVAALLAGLVAYGAGSLEVGGLFPSSDGIDGPEYFLLSLVLGTLLVIAPIVAVTRSLAHNHARGHIVAENPEGNVISRIQLASARHATAVVLVVVLITGGLGVGIAQITTDVDVADVLPRGNGNTTAAKNVTDEFKSSFTQQVTLQLPINEAACARDSEEILENRQSDPNCGNITDEVYVRALEELYQIMLDEQDILQLHIGLPTFYKLINWTIAGGTSDQNTDGDAAFSLPNTQMQGAIQYELVNQTVWASIASSVTPVIDPSFEQTAALFLVPTDSEASSQEIGNTALDFRDTYVEMVENGETRYTVWGEDNPPLFTVDIPVANAHSSKLAQEDFVTLFPIIFAFIVVTLYFSFRNFTAIGIAGASLLTATIWTYGAMGHMGIALNTLNLTVLPLILGVGIDFSIHQINEFSHLKHEGLSDEEALRVSGGFAGFAMFLATATSAAGLLIMTISPSLLMAQLGFLSGLGIISVYLLTITFVPALLKLAKSSDAMGQKFAPSKIVVRMVRGLSKNRIVPVLLVIIITGITAVGITNLGIEPFGEPALNFPEDDPLRQEHVTGLQGFYDVEGEDGEILKTNIVVFEGDNTDLQAHRYMDILQEEMAQKETLNLDTSRNLPFLVRTWLTVKDGGPGAAEELGREALRTCRLPTGQMIPGCTPGEQEQVDSYPRTRAEIQSTMDAMFASPLATFSSLFTDHPSYNISIMTLATTTGTFEEAEAAWFDVWDAVEATEGDKPHDLRVAFMGNTATNFLFIEEELPWLSYLGIVSGIVVALLSIMFTKSIRATTAILLVVGTTSVWWLGLLPAFDIGLAITLMLPAVFITSIGADYALHMTWNLIKNPDRHEVYGVVGKAVMYSAITDIGAFAIFTQTQNVAASEAMLATVIAIGVMFVSSLLVLSIFYPLKEPEDESLDYVPRTRIREAPAPPRTVDEPSPGPA